MLDPIIDLSKPIAEQFTEEPLKSSGITEKAIIDFLLKNDEGLVSFVGNQPYTINGNSITFTYSGTPNFQILRVSCKSKKHEGQFHLDIIDSNKIDKGGVGTIYKALATLRQDGDCLVKSAHHNNPDGRVAKHFDQDRYFAYPNRNSMFHLRAHSARIGMTQVQIMRAMPGENLADYLDVNLTTLTDAQRLMICYQILETYSQQVYQHGLLHRDIKPENIMIDVSTNPPVLNFVDDDFVASETGTFKRPIGTEAFVAPEIWEEIFYPPESYSYTYKSEIYALGRVLSKIIGVDRTIYITNRDEFSDGHWLNLSVKDLGKLLGDAPYKAMLIAIVKNMLSVNPADRLDLLTIKQKIKDEIMIMPYQEHEADALSPITP